MNAQQRSPDALFAGKYRLIRALGKGGMGEVWLAEEEGPRNFRRRVAIKKLLSRAEPGDVAHESFFAEAQVVAHLDHPNIVRLIELGVAEDTVFLALDYVDGPSLDRLVKKGGGPVSPGEAAYIGREVARALEAVHSLCDEAGRSYGVVHRDVSPSNILIARDARVRLTDFGIAKISGFGGDRTETGVFKGKLPYMPPEQGRGEPFDQRADIFSLGLSLLEAMLGRRVRKGETQGQLMMMIATRAIPPARELVPGLPAALAQVLDRATAFDPRKRTPDAGKLAMELDHALSSFGPGAEHAARAELRKRVEASLVAAGEALTGAHVRQPSPSQPQGLPEKPPPGTPVSEVYVRDAPAPGLAEAGPPSSRSALTVQARRAQPGDVDSDGDTPLHITPLPAAPAPSPSHPPSPPSATAPPPAARPIEPTTMPPPGRRRRALALVLSVAAGTAVAGVILWGLLAPPSEAPRDGAALPADSVAAPGTPPDPAPAQPAVTTAADAPPAPDAPDPTAAPLAPRTPDAPQPGPSPAPPGKAGPIRGLNPPAPTPSAAPAADPAAPGTLQVVVLPWADVSVDGRPAGTTPIAPISLPPGTHSVVLRNAELGASRTLSVVIKPGQPTLLRVDLRRTDSP